MARIGEDPGRKVRGDIKTEAFERCAGMKNEGENPAAEQSRNKNGGK